MRRLSPRAVTAPLVSLAAIAALATLPACSNHIDTPADPASAAINVQAAWVEIGDANQPIARVVTNFVPASAGDPLCPQLVVDGKISRMTLRAGAATAPQRPTASAPADSKPSSFPVSVCEMTLPAVHCRCRRRSRSASRSSPTPAAG